MRTSREALCLQETPLQKGLHVAAAVGNHQHIHRFGQNPVDDAVGLEKNLAVLAQPDSQEFLGPGSDGMFFF